MLLLVSFNVTFGFLLLLLLLQWSLDYLFVQMVVACRVVAADPSADASITNVVFMGMGEPLHNYDSVMAAVDIMVQPLGLHISHNKVGGSSCILKQHSARVWGVLSNSALLCDGMMASRQLISSCLCLLTFYAVFMLVEEY